MKQLAPRHKAKELVFGFYKIVGLDGFGYDCNPIDVIDNGLHKIAQGRAKQCALKCVDVVISSGLNLIDYRVYSGDIRACLNYWQEIKQEIEKL